MTGSDACLKAQELTIILLYSILISLPAGFSFFKHFPSDHELILEKPVIFKAQLHHRDPAYPGDFYHHYLSFLRSWRARNRRTPPKPFPQRRPAPFSSAGESRHKPVYTPHGLLYGPVFLSPPAGSPAHSAGMDNVGYPLYPCLSDRRPSHRHGHNPLRLFSDSFPDLLVFYGFSLSFSTRLRHLFPASSASAIRKSAMWIIIPP